MPMELEVAFILRLYQVELLEDLPELDCFILPTGGRGATQLHVARTMCRRAAQRVVTLVRDGVCDPNGMRYLNRLSDFFFASRWVNHKDGKEKLQYHETIAVPNNAVVVSLKEAGNNCYSK